MLLTVLIEKVELSGRKRSMWISAIKTGLNSGSLVDWCSGDSIVEETT